MLKVDFETQAWRNFKELCEKKLIELRSQNDGDLDAVKTAHLRGRINQIKAFLELDKPQPSQWKD